MPALLALALALALSAAVPSLAQTATLPAMNILSAPPVSPSDAQANFYGTSTGHTSSGLGEQPPEIVETARALKNDPNLIFEFVHNQIEVEYAFGLRKGALGALIEKSGTPFDQNALFVALVRQAGYTAQYQITQVTLTKAQFTAWTGVSGLQAACKLMAAGGIPVTFNHQPSWPTCITGTFNYITFLHVWSQVYIGNTWYSYDPSFKTYAAVSPGLDLMSKAQMSPGDAGSAAAATIDSGTVSGANYIHNVGTGGVNGLDAYLVSHGETLLGDLATNEADWDTDRVVGITKIVPAYNTAPGPLPYTVGPGLLVTGDIPDQYRSSLHVTVTAAVDGVHNVNLLNHLFYVDDIDGRRLGISSNFNFAGGFLNNPPPTSGQTISYKLVLDDVQVGADYHCATTGLNALPCPVGLSGFITLAATHPYAAVSGTYGAQTVTHYVSALASPLAIISGWGSVSPALAAKWSTEVNEDQAYPYPAESPHPCPGGDFFGNCWPLESASEGDFTDQKLGANWLAQFSRMLQVQAQIGASKADHQHSIGVVDRHGNIQVFYYPPDATKKGYYGPAGQFTGLDVDTAISITSTANDANARNAVARSVALAGSTLEASVLEQTEDLADSGSVASRFGWANLPDDEDPCFSSSNPRRFYDITPTSTRSNLYLYDGSANGCTHSPNTPEASASTWKNQLDLTLSPYLAAGFHITAPGESFLGPGGRFGPALVDGPQSENQGSLQRGGAVMATLFDGTDVVQIADVITGLAGTQKGGAGQPLSRFAEYDPAKAADILKDRFVDRSVALGVDLKTGAAGFTTPTLLSVGGKSAPYGLDYSRTFKAGFVGCSLFGPCTGPRQGGWNHNWDIRFTNNGSGLEALGNTSPRAAAGSLVAFLAMQDIFSQSFTANIELQRDVYAALTADWWRQQMVANVATVNRGFSGEQYVRLVDGTWLAPIGSPGVLTQTNDRTKIRDYCIPTGASPPPPGGDWHSTTRRWDFSTVSFALRNAGGDTINFANWNWNYDPTDSCGIVYGYEPTTWSFPQGPSLTFTYDFRAGVTGVTTSLGRTMTFTTDVNGHARATSTGRSAGETSAGIADAANDTYKFDYLGPLARSAMQRPVPYTLLQHVYDPTNGTTPGLEYIYDTRGLVVQASDADSLQLGTRGPYNWFIAEGGRGERDDPAGGAYTVYYDTDGDAVRHIDELGREVDSVYDGRHRATSRTYPEGDQDLFGYDNNDNTTSLTKIPNPNVLPVLSNIVVTAGYEGTWNKLSFIVDARSHRTDFTYFPANASTGASMLKQVQRPAVAGTRPTYTFAYDAGGMVNSEVDAAGYTTTQNYDSLENLISTTDGAAIVNGNPALNLTTTFTPDAYGNVVATVDPRGNAVTAQYDPMHRKTDEQARNGAATATPMAVSHFGYDANGRVILEQNASALNGSGVPTTWVATSTAYSPTGKIVQVTNPMGDLTQTDYDGLDRPVCVAVRMNPNVYSSIGATLVSGSPTSASLPLSACTLGTPGVFGNDRITQTNYDPVGQTISLVRAFGDPVQQTYATYAYGLDGEQLSVTDALSNKTSYNYDGFNRLAKTLFPVTNQGGRTSDSANVESYGYDPNGNRIALTKRDGTNVVYNFDVLNREASKVVPVVGGQPSYTVNSSYDLAGRQLSVLFASPAAGVAYAYDSAGRMKSETEYSRTLSFLYDNASNRSRVTWPDGFYATYAYDALNRVTGVVDSAGHTIAGFNYDPLNRRTSLARNAGAGLTTSYSYDATGRLTCLAQNCAANPPTGLAFTFGYNPASQTLTQSTSADVPTWTNYSPSSVSKTYDGLNRDAATAAIGTPLPCRGSGGYDCNGNILINGGASYAYDQENRLTGVSIPGAGLTESLSYDPLGRLQQTAISAGTTTQFLYEGDRLVAEYVGGAIQHRYAQGPGIDEPLAAYDSAGSVSWLHADRQGSIIAESNGSGTITASFAYGPFGEPQAWGGPRFAYTGQVQLSEAQLYYYKARAYDPASGRFLQTDPVGYASDSDLYAYVGGDPVNRGDPTGNRLCTGSRIDQGADGCASSPEPVGVNGGVPGTRPSDSSGDQNSAHAVAPPCQSCHVQKPNLPNTPPWYCAVWPCLPGEEYNIPPLTGTQASPQPLQARPPPADAHDPEGAKAPGKPGEAEGFHDPLGGEQWVPNPNPRGNRWGWRGDDGRIWVPTGKGGLAHPTPHWDVQKPRGGYDNIYPGGHVRPGN